MIIAVLESWRTLDAVFWAGNHWYCYCNYCCQLSNTSVCDVITYMFAVYLLRVSISLLGHIVRWRHCVFNLSVRLLPNPRLAKLHMARYKLYFIDWLIGWTRCFENDRTNVNAGWHNWSTGMKRSTLGVMKWSTLGVKRSKVKVIRDIFGSLPESSFSTLESSSFYSSKIEKAMPKSARCACLRVINDYYYLQTHTTLFIFKRLTLR